MPHAMLILGIRKTGACAVPGIFASLGAKWSATLTQSDEGNKEGYFESPPFMKFNDHQLSLSDSSGYDWRTIEAPILDSPPDPLLSSAKRRLVSKYADVAPVAFKQPRLCRLSDSWHVAFLVMGLAATTIIKFSPGSELAQSFQTRHGLTIQQCALSWLGNVVGVEPETHQMPRTFVLIDTASALVARGLKGLEATKAMLRSQTHLLARLHESSDATQVTDNVRHARQNPRLSRYA